MFVHGPYLILEASPEVVSSGNPITLTAWKGQFSGGVMIAVVDVNGSPTLAQIAVGVFDGSGQFLHLDVVPPGFSGYVITLLGIGVAPTGKPDLTNLEVVTLQ